MIVSQDQRQPGYSYELSQKVGQNFDLNFKPELSPKQMLSLGIFGGAYFTPEALQEFPKSWYQDAKLYPKPNYKEGSFFGIKASQSLKVWQQKGWIHPQDPRGWVQWYFRYYYGRRSDDDQRQIQRWINIQRHVTQLKNNCLPGDLSCRPAQRQALLHWARDSRKI